MNPLCKLQGILGRRQQEDLPASHGALWRFTLERERGDLMQSR